MNKVGKWFFVVAFLICSALFFTGLVEPDRIGSGIMCLCFAALAFSDQGTKGK